MNSFVLLIMGLNSLRFILLFFRDRILASIANLIWKADLQVQKANY